MIDERSQRDITDFVFISDDIHPVDAVIVLGAPWIELVQKAKEVYENVHPQRIILSGKYGTKG